MVVSLPPTGVFHSLLSSGLYLLDLLLSDFLRIRFHRSTLWRTSTGGPYYYNGIPGWLLWYESLAHYVLPIFVMILFALALPCRVFLQKSRLRRNTGWRQYRRMTIQLLCISMIYVFDLPYVIVTIVRWSGYPDFGTSVQGPYFYYCNYIPTMLFSNGNDWLGTDAATKSLQLVFSGLEKT